MFGLFSKKKWQTIDGDQAQEMIKAGGHQLIDVREPSEYKSGHIPGSVNIPLGLLEFRKNEIRKDKPVICICLSGGRSSNACTYLTDQGYEPVYNLSGGMSRWNGKTV